MSADHGPFTLPIVERPDGTPADRVGPVDVVELEPSRARRRAILVGRVRWLLLIPVAAWCVVWSIGVDRGWSPQAWRIANVAGYVAAVALSVACVATAYLRYRAVLPIDRVTGTTPDPSPGFDPGLGPGIGRRIREDAVTGDGTGDGNGDGNGDAAGIRCGEGSS
jgi:hypothetical protein